MDVFDLVAKITLNADEYTKGLSEAGNKLQAFGKGIGTVAKVGAAAATAAVGTVTAIAGGFASGAAQLAEYGDNIDKMSQKMGMSAKAYQEWDAVLQHSGTSIDAMKRGMTTLSQQAEKGAEEFTKLGISQDKLASMSQEELFAATIEGLQNMEAGTERTVTAQKLLGGSAKELGALLNTSAKETQEMKDRVNELGGVMSDKAVKAAARYQDSLQDMTTALSGVKNKLLSDFLPGITTVMDGLTEIFSGGDGKAKITEGVSSFVDNVAEAMPKVMEAGGAIISGVVEAIGQNLPQLAGMGATMLSTIAGYMTDSLPGFFETVTNGLTGLADYMRANAEGFAEMASAFISSFAEGLATSLPEALPAIADIFMSIVDAFSDPEGLSNMVDAALAIILALADGIISAQETLLSRMPEIVGNIATALIENAPKILEAGVQLIIMLASGMVQSIPQVVAVVPQVIAAIVGAFASAAGQLMQSGQKILDDVKNGFMSRVQEAAQWGRDMIDNFISGIMSKIGDVISAASNVASAVKDVLGFSEPKIGPLSNFHTFAPDMMALFAQGVRDKTAMVQDQVEKSFDFSYAVTTPPAFSADERAEAEGVLRTMQPIAGTLGRGITIILELDKREFARAVYQANNEEVQRVGVNIAEGYA